MFIKDNIEFKVVLDNKVTKAIFSALLLVTISFQILLSQGVPSLLFEAFAGGGGDGDGNRYAGPINNADSSERVIYCTFNENFKAPICQGTSRSDIIIGTVQEDFIEGKGNDDAIQGRAANDDIFGQKGNDDIQGGGGADNIYGENGDDLLYGGPEGDFMVGGKGNDELYGGPGEDIIEGGPGNNYFDCGDDYDIIIDFDPSKDIASNNCEDIRTDL